MTCLLFFLLLVSGIACYRTARFSRSWPSTDPLDPIAGEGVHSGEKLAVLVAQERDVHAEGLRPREAEAGPKAPQAALVGLEDFPLHAGDVPQNAGGLLKVGRAPPGLDLNSLN